MIHREHQLYYLPFSNPHFLRTLLLFKIWTSLMRQSLLTLHSEPILKGHCLWLDHISPPLYLT